MCHALLHDPKFLALLLRIDHDLAAQTRADGCPCGGALHRADYPRKPRGCPIEVRRDHSSRLSFCCSVCRRRATSMSVRFLARRVYLALAVVLVSARPGGPTPAAARLGMALGATRRTLARWRVWWCEQFPLTPLWRATCARFMPPLSEVQLPGELITRFAGPAPEALMRLLVWLSPVTVGRGQPVAIKLNEAG
ncbi:MAG: hypothetical protein C0499_12235 [Zymomonas sp.]|nr:hypothetical protein [Zymomonas sp.]